MSNISLSKPPPGILLNRNHPLAQDLIGCWLLNEGSGLITNDLTGNGNTGVLTNFEPFSATSGWTGGNQGTALQFNGTNDFINCGNNASLNTPINTITVEALVYLRNVAVIKELICKGSTVSTGFSYVLRFNAGTSTFRFSLRNAASVASADSIVTPILINTWYSVVGVYNAANLTVFVNGIPGTPVAQTGNIKVVPNSIFIGTNDNGPSTNFLNGIINLVRIWKSAKSAQQIQQLFAQPYAMFKTP